MITVAVSRASFANAGAPRQDTKHTNQRNNSSNNNNIMGDLKDDIYKNDADYYAALEGVPLINVDNDNSKYCPTAPIAEHRFPGMRRTPLAPTGPPAGTVLFRTAGNALQAMPVAVLEEQNLVAVRVPNHAQPGDTLYVRNDANRTDNVLVETIVPADAWPGHVFMVSMPDQGSTLTTGTAGGGMAEVMRVECRSSSDDEAATAVVVVARDAPNHHEVAINDNDLALHVVVDEEQPLLQPPVAIVTATEVPLYDHQVDPNDSPHGRTLG